IQLGMPLAFTIPSPGAGADFSGIDGTNNLYITDVVHQAYVSVAETGTTAAGATGVVVTVFTGIATYTPPPTPFVVNQPFIFAIVDNTTNTVLFMGRVSAP
ncbi:MAG TPA: serpin family protein, partial [bacterium]|nr:serpin family protein [bacterium]